MWFLFLLILLTIVLIFKNNRKSTSQVAEQEKELRPKEIENYAEIEIDKEGIPFYLVLSTKIDGIFNARDMKLVDDFEDIPRLFSAAWLLLTEYKKKVSENFFIIETDDEKSLNGFKKGERVEHLKTAEEVLSKFLEDLKKCKVIVGHNVKYHAFAVGAEMLRRDIKPVGITKKKYCTMIKGTQFAGIYDERSYEYTGTTKYKWPKLKELFESCISNPYELPIKTDRYKHPLFDSRKTAYAFRDLE